MSEEITITKEEKKEFILKSLIHYFKDPTQCGFSIEMYCAYRSENGKKCAVGQYIADEHYKPKMEGYNIGSDIMFIDIEELLIPEAKNKLTREEWTMLQSVHDALARHYNHIHFSGTMLDITNEIEKIEVLLLIDLQELKELLINFKQRA